MKSLKTDNIMIIDDEEIVLEAIARVIRGLGYDVMTSAGALEGIELFSRHAEDVDLVILDWMMPIRTGLEVLREIHEIRPEIPVILTSGYLEVDLGQSIADLQLAGYLQKPWRQSVVKAMLAEILGEQDRTF